MIGIRAGSARHFKESLVKLKLGIAVGIVALSAGCSEPLAPDESTVSAAEACSSNCCFGPTCDNLDPKEQHCAVTSVRAIDIPCNFTCPVSGPGHAGVLQNVYSAPCNANWAVLIDGNPAGRPFSISIDTSYVLSGHAVHKHLCFPEDCSSTYTGTAYPLWTNMVNGQNTATACVETSNGGATPCVPQ